MRERRPNKLIAPSEVPSVIGDGLYRGAKLKNRVRNDELRVIQMHSGTLVLLDNYQYPLDETPGDSWTRVDRAIKHPSIDLLVAEYF